jgi:hypothetical protein
MTDIYIYTKYNNYSLNVKVYKSLNNFSHLDYNYYILYFSQNNVYSEKIFFQRFVSYNYDGCG